jgi:hypothetical protein
MITFLKMGSIKGYKVGADCRSYVFAAVYYGLDGCNTLLRPSIFYLQRKIAEGPFRNEPIGLQGYILSS